MGTGKCLGWLYPVLLLLLAVHTVDCASFQPLRSQHSPPGWFLGLHQCPTTILSCKLFGRNFCEQQLAIVLGKLFNTVIWSTFCVSFICVLTILGWLQCFEIFKINYLVTSNVRFGMVSINPVTYNQYELLCTWLCMLFHFHGLSYCYNLYHLVTSMAAK